jgi:hypothetical protein
MTFAENPAISGNEPDPKHSTVVEPKREGNSNPVPGVPTRIDIDGSLDSKEAGNRKAGAFRHSLIAKNTIRHAAETFSIPQKFSHSGNFFDKLHTNSLVSPIQRTGV